MAPKDNQPTTLVSLRIPTDVLADIDRIAAITERSRSWVIVRAMKTYLRAEGQRVVDTSAARARLPKTEASELDDLIADLRAATDAEGADDEEPASRPD